MEWAKTGITARQRAIRVLEQALADLKADDCVAAGPLEAPHLEGARPRPPRKARKKAAKARAQPKAPANAPARVGAARA